MKKVFDREVKGMLTQAVLIRRGWSLPAIEKLQGQPDDLQRNPFQSTSVPNVRLYREERVLAAEQGEGWKKREASSKTRLKQFEAVALPEGLEHAMERTGWKLVGFKQVDLTPDGSFNGPARLLNTYTLKKGDRTTVLNHAPNARQFNSAFDEYVKVHGGSLIYADTYGDTKRCTTRLARIDNELFPRNRTGAR
jgi:hypothetical protein